MSRKKTYHHDLRAIGQALEAKRIEVFELKNQDHAYVVRGNREKDRSLASRLRDWRERMSGHSQAALVRYTFADIERLERQGRANRRRPGRLPDFYSLSNTLRTVGAYLDAREAELLEIYKRPLSITILYQNSDGHPDLEERTIASFYTLFLDLYEKRNKPNRSR